MTSGDKIKILALTCEEPYSIAVQPSQNVEVEFSDFFVNAGQSVTLIPHLLKSGEDSLAVYYELEERQLGGQLIYLVDERDWFLRNMLSEAGVCLSFYSAPFPLQQSLEFKRAQSSNFEGLPFSLVFLDQELKIASATDLARKQLSYFLTNEKVKSVLENALGKALLEGDFCKLELLNFFGYCHPQKLDNGWLVYLVSLQSIFVTVTFLECVLRLNQILLGLTHFNLGADLAVAKILDQAILLADKFLPQTVRIEVINSRNYTVSGSADLALMALLRCFFALAFQIKFSGKIEIEVLAKGELNYITISISGFNDKIAAQYQGLDSKVFDFFVEKQFIEFLGAAMEDINSSDIVSCEMGGQPDAPYMIIKIKSSG